MENVNHRWLRLMTAAGMAFCLAMGFVGFSATAHAEVTRSACPVQMAPAKFAFKKALLSSKGVPTNQGIIPTGFVGLSDGTPTVHGIDVSKWQSSANFRLTRDCGGKFVYVRLSASDYPDNELEYRVHWANARALGLYTGPYHYLKVPALLRDIRNLDDAAINTELDNNKEQARAQARLFTSRLLEVLGLDASDASDKEQLGGRILPIVVAAGSVSVVHAQLTADQRAQVGRFYTDALCEWMASVHAVPELRQVPIMLFVYPYIYNDYKFDAAKCDIPKAQLWISYASPDGGRYPPENDAYGQIMRGICSREGVDRCRFHHYTSNGNFLDFRQINAIDLDRYYGTEQELSGLLSGIHRP